MISPESVIMIRFRAVVSYICLTSLFCGKFFGKPLRVSLPTFLSKRNIPLDVPTQDLPLESKNSSKIVALVTSPEIVLSAIFSNVLSFSMNMPSVAHAKRLLLRSCLKFVIPVGIWEEKVALRILPESGL